MTSVTIIRTGVANVASVKAAFQRLGCVAEESDDPHVVADAPVLVLPGVGAFAAGMRALTRRGLDAAIKERIAAGRPTLTTCLGLHLLCRSSEESPGVVGLGVIDADVRRFGPAVRTPQMGWNRISAEPKARFVRSGWAYFANSFRIAAAPPGWSSAWSENGGRFVAALERGGVLACQFHPEISGAWGLELMQRWLQAARKAVPC